MKSVQNFKIVSNMKAYSQVIVKNLYFSDAIQCLQKKVDAPDPSQDSISSDQVLLPDLKSIILNQSDLIREDYEGLRLTETHSRSLTTNSSSKLFIFEEQFVNIHSISSDLISDEF